MPSKHYLAKKERRNLERNLQEIGIAFDAVDRVQVEESRDSRKYFLKNRMIGFENDSFVPLPAFLNLVSPKNHVITVDDGAVPHVLNGANIFCKGIISMTQDVKNGDHVFIANSEGIFIAVGISTVDYDPDISSRSGEAVRTVKYNKPLE